MKKKFLISCISLLIVCGITCGTLVAAQMVRGAEDDAPAFIADSTTRFIDKSIPETKTVTSAPLHIDDIAEEEQQDETTIASTPNESAPEETTESKETVLTYDYTDTEIENKTVDVYHDEDDNQYYYENDRLQYYINTNFSDPSYVRDKSTEVTELQALSLAKKHMAEAYGDALDGFILTSSSRTGYVNEDCYHFIYKRLGGQDDFITIEWAQCVVTIYGELYQSCVVTDSVRKRITADDLAHLKQSTLESWALKQFAAEHADLFEKYSDQLTVSSYEVCYIDKELSVRAVVYMGRMDYNYYYPI